MSKIEPAVYSIGFFLMFLFAIFTDPGIGVMILISGMTLIFFDIGGEER